MLVENAGRKLRVGGFQVTINLGNKFFRHEGFHDESLRTGALSVFPVGLAVCRGDAYNGDMFGLRIGFELFAYLVSAHHGHHDVQKNKTGLIIFCDVHGGESIVGC